MKRPLLHIEELPGEQLNLKMNDLPNVARMIRTVMESRMDIGAVFVTAVVSYAKDHNLNFEQLKKLGK